MTVILLKMLIIHSFLSNISCAWYSLFLVSLILSHDQIQSHGFTIVVKSIYLILCYFQLESLSRLLIINLSSHQIHSKNTIVHLVLLKSMTQLLGFNEEFITFKI